VAMKARLPRLSPNLWVKHGTVAAAAYCQLVSVQSFERKFRVVINLYYTQSPGRRARKRVNA